MTDYEKLREIYLQQGHTVFIMALSVLLKVGSDGLEICDGTELIPGNLFTEGAKLQIMQAAKVMANSPGDVLLAVIQRVLPEISDPAGVRIPFSHAFGDQQCVCPLCGGELEYQGDQVIIDDGTLVSWVCKSCGAIGKEGADIVFGHHYDVYDAEGNMAPDR